jgi:transcriptional regulator NrdR family protein
MNETGMLYPKCNGATKVVNSRFKPDGSKKRSRECLSCGFRFNTWERVRIDEKHKRNGENDV